MWLYNQAKCGRLPLYKRLNHMNKWVHAMHGNVWQCCADLFNGSPDRVILRPLDADNLKDPDGRRPGKKQATSPLDPAEILR
jgi:hypothetical protein